MTMKLWEVDSGRLLQTFEGHTAEVTSVGFSRDSTRVISSSGDDKLMRSQAFPFYHYLTHRVSSQTSEAKIGDIAGFECVCVDVVPALCFAAAGMTSSKK